jgi:hypothetical protein
MVSRSLTADQGQEPWVGELLKRTEQRIQSRRALPRSIETAHPASLRTTPTQRARGWQAAGRRQRVGDALLRCGRRSYRAHGAGGASRACRCPAGTACSQVAARRGLVVDRRYRMGESRAAGGPWGDGLGQGDVGRLVGERAQGGWRTGGAAVCRSSRTTRLLRRRRACARWRPRAV